MTKRLWAPWRLSYIAQTRRPRKKGCLFCGKKKRGSKDSGGGILTRGRWGFSLLNRYPYNNGHLMVAPYRHVGKLSALTVQEWQELFWLIQDALDRLDEVLHPDGYNLGINVGKAAGAGIPGHLHLHIVPRWNGDTNFMPVTADTKVISQSMTSALALLRQAGPRPSSSSAVKRRRL